MKEAEGFSPEEQSVLEKTIENYRSAIERDSRVGWNIVFQLILAFCAEFEKNPLQKMQQIFDKKKIDVKIVAIPVRSEVNRLRTVRGAHGTDIQFDAWDYDCKLPLKSDKDYPYYCWLIVQRVEEYYDLLAKLDMTPEENFARLADTGMHKPKPGIDQARILKAKYN